MADRDTILQRFDEDPVFKEWEEPKFFKVISETLFLETLMSAPRLIEVPRFTVAANGPESPLSRAGRRQLIACHRRLILRTERTFACFQERNQVIELARLERRTKGRHVGSAINDADNQVVVR